MAKSMRLKLNPTSTPDQDCHEERHNKLYNGLVGKTITLAKDGEVIFSNWRFWLPKREVELDSSYGETHARFSSSSYPRRFERDSRGRLYLR